MYNQAITSFIIQYKLNLYCGLPYREDKKYRECRIGEDGCIRTYTTHVQGRKLVL